MKNEKFGYMSTNEWLGDPTTHFMKSGEALRSPSNREADELAKFIPKIANGVKVEYDISYDIPDNLIHGYKITDLLTKCITISPQSSKISRENISQISAWEPTESGREIVKKLQTSITDKYIQSKTDQSEVKPFGDLIILPGTNVMTKEDAVDFEKIDELVRAGAFVKIHPITSKVWKTMLKQRWGDRCIDADAPLYLYLRACKKVWFTMSSETGLAACILGKELGIIGGKKNYNLNFECLYRGIDKCPEKRTILEKITALLSHPESGLITVYHENPEECIKAYFDHMAENYRHKTL